MLVLVTYDVSSDGEDGAKRLRRVAKICQSFGQRVQKSVFECQINQMQLEKMERDLLKVMDKTRDSVRLYKLGQRALAVIEHGNIKAVDFEGALII
jgi:CRISPR-associated protein Cas2